MPSFPEGDHRRLLKDNVSESKMIHVQWVRSGIGFSRKQKKMVRSLGLTRLNRVAVLPDTPSVRGLVAAIPHLVRIVEAKAAPAWAAIPEYSITAPEAVSMVSAASGQDDAAPEAETGSATTAEGTPPAVKAKRTRKTAASSKAPENTTPEAAEDSSGDSATQESAAEEKV